MSEGLLELSRGVLGDVFVEGARERAGGDDALDGGVVERAEGGGVLEGAVELLGGVALAEQ